MAARFESEYIFCWLDWDGDNILMNGGIIDYGSLRQFGLFHHEYRYDDVERMSTTITEQKNKARYIVQTFAQIVAALLQGQKTNIKGFSRHRSLLLFDKVFSRAMDETFLYKIGIDPARIDSLLKSRPVNRALARFRQSYDYFERAKSSKGLYPVNDGISWDAIFCMRDCMREMPGVLLGGTGALGAPDFIDMIRSRYASNDDVMIAPYRRQQIKYFQEGYRCLLDVIARVSDVPLDNLLRTVRQRSAIINRADRITGDAIIHVAEYLIKAVSSLNNGQTLNVFNEFVTAQVLSPEYQRNFRVGNADRLKSQDKLRKKNIPVYRQMIQAVVDHREGL
jgi:hypothetical protein